MSSLDWISLDGPAGDVPARCWCKCSAEELPPAFELHRPRRDPQIGFTLCWPSQLVCSVGLTNPFTELRDRGLGIPVSQVLVGSIVHLYLWGLTAKRRELKNPPR
ncbi:hypothetical protein LNQ03_08470 [Klebsiella pneumoniae subsp. pneumoniae]|nr:hypothetical protein [Klebsiella pneumoniae subsp. pneumoniae]